MTRVAFVFPLALGQLHVWQRTGVHFVLAQDGVWSRLDDRGLPVLTSANRHRLAKLVPVFEDDFEVVVAMASDTNLVDAMVAESAASGLLTPISSLLAAFPISERGERLLEGKLSTAIPLGPVLSLDELGEREREWRRASRVFASDRLVHALGLGDEPAWSAEVRDEALRVLSSARGGGPKGIVETVLRYARQIRPGSPMITNDDIGYFEDLGRIISDLGGASVAVDREKLKALRGVLDEVRSSAQDQPLMEVADSTESVLDTLKKECLPLSPLSIAVFLKLRELGEEPHSSSVASVVTMVKRCPARFRAELALAARLAGAFQGFALVSQISELLDSAETGAIETREPEPVESIDRGDVDPAKSTAAVDPLGDPAPQSERPNGDVLTGEDPSGHGVTDEHPGVSGAPANEEADPSTSIKPADGNGEAQTGGRSAAEAPDESDPSRASGHLADTSTSPEEGRDESLGTSEGRSSEATDDEPDPERSMTEADATPRDTDEAPQSPSGSKGKRERSSKSANARHESEELPFGEEPGEDKPVDR